MVELGVWIWYLEPYLALVGWSLLVAPAFSWESSGLLAVIRLW